jgi:hypothetical protein
MTIDEEVDHKLKDFGSKHPRDKESSERTTYGPALEY